MTLDPKIIEAVQSATVQENQDKALADKIIAWMSAVTSGNEDIGDDQSARRHLNMLYEAVKTPKGKGSLAAGAATSSGAGGDN